MNNKAINSPRSRLSGILASLMATSWMISAAPALAAMAEFVEAIPLSAQTRLVLPFEADHVIAGLEGQAFFAVQRRNAAQPGGRVTVYDFRTGKAGRSVDLVHDVECFVQNSQSGLLYVAGNEGETFHVSRIDPKTGAVASFIFKGNMQGPSIETSDAGTVYVGNRLNNSINVIEPDRFLEASASMERFKATGEAQSGVVRYTGPVADISVSADGAVLFVSDAAEPRISALDIAGKQNVVDQIGFSANVSGTPLAMQAQTSGSNRSLPGVNTSVMAADVQRSRLLLMDYNPSFQSLDIVSDVEFRLSLASAAVSPDMSPLLISTNADQTVALLASRESTAIRLFGRNGAAIEVAPNFEDLPSSPTALDVSDDGQLAIVVLSDRKSISVLSAKGQTISGGDTVSIDPKTKIETTSEDVRAIQRALIDLGYSVGVVDGFYGEKTQRALARALKENKISDDFMRLNKMTPEELSKIETASADVRAIQQTLTDLGYSVGEIDGFYGAKTQRAFARALEENKITNDFKLLNTMTPEELSKAVKVLDQLK